MCLRKPRLHCNPKWNPLKHFIIWMFYKDLIDFGISSIAGWLAACIQLKFCSIFIMPMKSNWSICKSIFVRSQLGQIEKQKCGMNNKQWICWEKDREKTSSSKKMEVKIITLPKMWAGRSEGQTGFIELKDACTVHCNFRFFLLSIPVFNILFCLSFCLSVIERKKGHPSSLPNGINHMHTQISLLTSFDLFEHFCSVSTLFATGLGDSLNRSLFAWNFGFLNWIANGMTTPTRATKMTNKSYN